MRMSELGFPKPKAREKTRVDAFEFCSFKGDGSELVFRARWNPDRVLGETTIDYASDSYT